MQKRTPNKKRNPNKWAKTGGQVDSGETVEEAIFREVKEELGIEISKEQIKVVDIYKSNDKNKRFGYNFIFVVNYKIKDYILNYVDRVDPDEYENVEKEIEEIIQEWESKERMILIILFVIGMMRIFIGK